MSHGAHVGLIKIAGYAIAAIFMLAFGVYGMTYLMLFIAAIGILIPLAITIKEARAARAAKGAGTRRSQ